MPSTPITSFPTSGFPTTSTLGPSTSLSTTTISSLPTTTTVDALLKLCLLWSVLNKPELQRFGDDPDFPEVPSPPLICDDYLLGPNTVSTSGSVAKAGNESLDDDEMRGNFSSSRKVIHKIDHKYSSRSFAVIGALAGIVFILLIMALTTCIRHRRELYLTDDPISRERGYARDVLINHLRQFRSTANERRVASLDPPPSYEDVVKVTPQQTNPASDSPTSESADVILERTVIVSQADDPGSQPPSYLEAVASLTPSDAVPPYCEEPNIKNSEGVTTIQIE